MALEIVERTLQRRRPARPADQATVETDRQDFRRALLALFVKDIEGIAQHGLEILAGGEPGLDRKTHVVAVHCVGDDELILLPDAGPIGQIVAIAVGDIGEITLFGGKLNRVHRAAAGIPAARRLAGDLGVEPDRLADLLALLVRAHILVLDPFQPMAGDLPAGLLHRRDLFGRAGERRRHAIDRDGNVLQHPMDAPESGARAIFVDRFHVPVALARPGLGTGDLGQEGFRGRIAVKDVVLAALFVIEDELNRDLGPVRPVGCRGICAVAGHVARIACHR